MVKKRYLHTGLILILLAGAGAGGYAHYRLHQERNDLRSQVASGAARIDLLQEKYKEKKAVEANLMRKTMMLQGQLSKAISERNEVEESMELKIAEKTAELQSANKELQQRAQDLEKKRDQLAAELDELQEQHGITAAELDRKSNELAELTGVHQTTEHQLVRTERSLDRCADHNTQLSVITQELLHNYSETGVVGSLAIAEPFTQLKQVEMERIVQEYLDRVEKHHFEKRQ